MKTLKHFGVLLLALLLIVPFLDVEAQKQKRKKEQSKSISSYIDFYGGGGYSALLHNTPETSVPGGGAGMLGFGYFMKHKSNFNFQTGLEFMFLNSMTKVNDFSYAGDYIYSDAYKQNHTMLMMLDFADYKEQQNRLSLNIPLLFGAQIKQFYFLAGAKAGLGLMGNYSFKGVMTRTMRDPELIDDMGNMPTHDLVVRDVKYGSKLKFGLDVAVSAEAGLCIDEWMPANAKEYGSGKEKRAISYRVGAFVDYGLMNINNNTPQDLLLNFPEIKPVGDGSFEVPVANIDNVQNHSILAVKENGKTPALNSLVVGAKFTVLMGIDKAPKPIKKKPRRRPVVRDVTFIPDPTYFYLFVHDFETEQPLDALVKVYTLDQPNDTIFTGMTDKETGFVEEQIDNGKYGISITRPGYIDYSDTLFRVISDTLYVDLQPIKKNTVVILRNLLFDTDKTVIRNVSTQSLEEMYQLLAKNPNMRIRITGHTDNVGTERYNKKLSEGRAKAVFDEMVKRGIDPSRMEWNGRGSKEPIESNATPEGRAENRRVEFKILSNE
jgi:outer membrane protein OmpA-like peptidoglycan-associated protein